VRIIAGRHRGRRLAAPAGPGTRPTSDRLREAVFDILAHNGWGPGCGDPVEGAVVLDAFCGTGALALEALSRGAARAVLLDSSAAALAVARANARALGEEGRCLFLGLDATRPPAPPAVAGLAFLDPPYGEGLGPPALAALARAGWLAPGAVVVLEQSSREPVPVGEAFTRLAERTYGGTRVIFLRYGEARG
jgi:16S rRNA (guanine966-N2)-methyltransferase